MGSLAWPHLSRRDGSATHRLFNGSPFLPKGDRRPWPALAGSAITSQSYMEIVDGGQMFDDRLQRMSSEHFRRSADKLAEGFGSSGSRF
jgi:hypothetical protein